jgi:hypothetical protein
LAQFSHLLLLTQSRVKLKLSEAEKGERGRTLRHYEVLPGNANCLNYKASFPRTTRVTHHDKRPRAKKPNYVQSRTFDYISKQHRGNKSFFCTVHFTLRVASAFASLKAHARIEKESTRRLAIGSVQKLNGSCHNDTRRALDHRLASSAGQNAPIHSLHNGTCKRRFCTLHIQPCAKLLQLAKVGCITLTCTCIDQLHARAMPQQQHSSSRLHNYLQRV